MHKTIVSIKYFPYLCIRQLVILIYIYHFPKRNKPSVRIAYFFSVEASKASLPSQDVSIIIFLLTSCFFKSPKYGVIFIHGPLWAQIHDSQRTTISRSLTFDVKPFYLSAHDCPVIPKWSVNKCNDGD